jgi:hypothetical protein
VLDVRAAAPTGGALPDQAHNSHRARQGRRAALPDRREHTLHRHEDADDLSLNEIGRLRLRLSSPLFLDEYRRNRATGSFILIDESTNDTVGAGMVF